MNRFVLLALAATLLPASSPAQDPALVEAAAPILMAEDRRALDVAVLPPALEHPDPLVRRLAVTAVGRIGDREGRILLVPRLDDRDPGVVAQAFFALGLLKDRAAVGAIGDRLRRPDTLTTEALAEAATALARIGGDEAAQVLAGVIGGVGELTPARRQAMLAQATLESWRLGSAAPVDRLIALARDTSVSIRWRATYALGRLAAPAAGEVLLTAMRDPIPIIRETAAKALGRSYIERAGLPRDGVASELVRTLNDQTPGVRINALGGLATVGDSTHAGDVAPLLRDEDRNVRVAAATTLGSLRGVTARDALVAALPADANEWGVRRAALLALARVDSAAFVPWGERWLGAPDPFDRMVAVEAWQSVGAGGRLGTVARADADPRVRAEALGAWAATDTVARAELETAARAAWTSDEPALRVAGLQVLAREPTEAALDLVAAAWDTGVPELREAGLGLLGRWARRDRSVVDRLAAPSRRALLQRPDDPVLRATAARTLPTLARVWGGVTPIETGRTLEDYRQLAARYLFAPDNPRVAIDVDGRGRIEVELLPRDAPLTVANFLRLVDRRYFDNVRWHRVVPNFVVQDGDPTGTGSGGPGWSIRDEINRLRYDVPMVGMALSGPDTGGSQWFINLSPQPHLDGGYTIFGRVVGNYGPLRRVLQGDLIRSIQRVGAS